MGSKQRLLNVDDNVKRKKELAGGGTIKSLRGNYTSEHFSSVSRDRLLMLRHEALMPRLRDWSRDWSSTYSCLLS